jgi:hypothetical protein
MASPRRLSGRSELNDPVCGTGLPRVGTGCPRVRDRCPRVRDRVSASAGQRVRERGTGCPRVRDRLSPSAGQAVRGCGTGCPRVRDRVSASAGQGVRECGTGCPRVRERCPRMRDRLSPSAARAPTSGRGRATGAIRRPPREIRLPALAAPWQATQARRRTPAISPANHVERADTNPAVRRQAAHRRFDAHARRLWRAGRSFPCRRRRRKIPSPRLPRRNEG